MKSARLWLARLRGRATLTLSDAAIAPVFAVGGRMEAEKIALADHERELLESFLAQVGPGETVLDIGANIGLYSLPIALKTGPGGRVHAFEPVPLWFGRLEENLRLNGIGNVFVHKVGLSDRSGACGFTMKNDQGSGMGSIMHGFGGNLNAAERATIEIRLERGDDYLSAQGIPVPRAVKIDVEGAEIRVMRGLQETLRNSGCRFVMCEVHPQYLDTNDAAVEQTLAGFGFRCRRTPPRGHEYHLLCTR